MLSIPLSQQKLVQTLRLDYLSRSGAKGKIALGNIFLKEGKFYRASNLYFEALATVVNWKYSSQKNWDWNGAKAIINEEYKLLYFPIGKVASTSLMHFFTTISDRDDKEEALQLLKNRYFHSYVNHNLTLVANMSRQEAYAVLRDPRYFKFGFVRNPWARIASAYLDKFVVKPVIRKPLLQWEFIRKVIHDVYKTEGSKPNYQKSITFRQFVNYLSTTKDDNELDGHWRPQTTFFEGIELDFVGRLENLEEDFQVVLGKAKITDYALPSSNKSRSAIIKKTESSASQEKIENYYGSKHPSDLYPSELLSLKKLPSYKAFYTDDLIQMISERYQEDVDAFGYTF